MNKVFLFLSLLSFLFLMFVLAILCLPLKIRVDVAVPVVEAGLVGQQVHGPAHGHHRARDGGQAVRSIPFVDPGGRNGHVGPRGVADAADHLAPAADDNANAAAWEHHAGVGLAGQGMVRACHVRGMCGEG